MSYTRELKLKIREIKARIALVNLEIEKKIKSKQDFTEEISKLNSLTVDLATTNSRIENLGRDVYLPTIYKSNG